jgi:hypothetical protein
VLLILGFVVLMLIARPGARLPPTVFEIENRVIAAPLLPVTEGLQRAS